MAYSESAVNISVIAGATFSSSDQHKFVVLDSVGHAVLPNTTGNVFPLGVLVEPTNSTSSTGVQPVTVQVAGVAKVKMTASTLSAGDFVGSSTLGFGIAPSSDAYTAGRIVSGSSGAANRIVSVFLQAGPLSAP